MIVFECIIIIKLNLASASEWWPQAQPGSPEEEGGCLEKGRTEIKISTWFSLTEEYYDVITHEMALPWSISVFVQLFSHLNLFLWNHQLPCSLSRWTDPPRLTSSSGDITAVGLTQSQGLSYPPRLQHRYSRSTRWRCTPTITIQAVHYFLSHI